MSPPEDRLRAEGISTGDLTHAKDAIAQTTRAVFTEYDVPLDTPEPIIEVVQSTIFQTVIDLGTELDDRSITDQFEMLLEDLDTPSSARSNILFAIGAADPPTDLAPTFNRLSGTVLVRHYGHTEPTTEDAETQAEDSLLNGGVTDKGRDRGDK